MAFKILLHTFRMIFGNLGQALKVSVGPYLILLLTIGALFFAATSMSGESIGNLPILMLFILPLMLFVTSWVAVSWHRFILLEEYTSVLPAVAGRPIWSYVGKGILLALIIMLIAVPTFYLIGALGLGAFLGPQSYSAQSGSAGLLATLIILLAVFVFISFISLRLGIALVGTALGKPLGFGAAWAATGKISGVIFGVAVLLVLINAVPAQLFSRLAVIAPIVVAVFNLAWQWLTIMLGVSVLTTIYGHVIEERPLVD
ncbi:hypothetical protein FHS72_000939 [Loktanella ponticola]|uniref:Uncharacterized protein n=1 Tax=Yoonia ponticola TaxID=1524255 RepID=A0A7W9BIT2_9RHOB|nr:hypothetical protein [Yoonia ponticola]MBB5721332.1 hypothetical protein [Yoonia ponticola]